MSKKIKLNPDNLNLRECCYWYPCHNNISKEDYDCRTCYCPLYKTCSVIQNDKFGGYLLEYIDGKGNEQKVWACERCTILHIKECADLYFKLKRQNISDEDIINKLNESEELHI